MKKLFVLVLTALLTGLFIAPSPAISGQPSGIPHWVIPNDVEPVVLEPFVIADSQGRLVTITNDNELKVDASVSVTSGNSIVVDDEGDTANYRIQPSGDTTVTISPGGTNTFSFPEASVVSIVPHDGLVHFEYGNSADTNSMPVTQNQIKESPGQASITSLTAFVEHTEASSVTVTVRTWK